MSRLRFVHVTRWILCCLALGCRIARAQVGIVAIDPTPGTVEMLDRVSVTFSVPVNGVSAADFLVNGVPATSHSGGGRTYTFVFRQPPYGAVTVTWGPLHAIQDLGQPPTRFDASVAGSNWSYDLVDPRPPAVDSVLPVPGTALRHLTSVQVVFNRPVTGVDSGDLRLDGVAALEVEGLGAGPYRFRFDAARSGQAQLAWTPGHGIRAEGDEARRFEGEGWSYPVSPLRPPPGVVLREILAENLSGLKDEEGDPEDWIELFNGGDTEVDLAGWSLTNDPDLPDLWVFPSLVLPPSGSTLLWASAKDRTNQPTSRYLHTNFRLADNGGTLLLSGPELPRMPVDRLDYPRQAPNFSYGLSGPETNRVFRFFPVPTPGKANGTSLVTNALPDLHFSVPRGFFAHPFTLSIASPLPGVEIRYTTNGSVPTPTNGLRYTQPIPITANRVIRAAGFASNQLPSRVQTHTYLYNLANNRRLLPVVSLVTATNHLYGRTGILEFNPRNTLNHGIAWERPVSVEWIRPEDNGGFQVDAGIRVAGGDYIRGRYAYNTTALPQSKYSFRLYFRGEYGEGKLRYPVFPGTTVPEFDTLHLRAGMNDHSNPLLKDEFVRTLCDQVGIVASHGTFVHLFLNGAYRGIYNPAERVNEDFLQAYHGGGALWDVIGVGNVALGGDSIAWTALRTAARRDLTIRTNYLDVAARMDLENFVDYLLPHLWSDNDDWPHNNTRAARERVPGSKFRFYPWDAEFSFGSHGVSYDTIANTLSSTSPPWGTTDYQQLFNSLKRSPEFRLLFADRVHRAFFNGGPLTDERIRAAYTAMRARLSPSISGFSDVITPWINGRRRHMTNAFQKAGFLASSNAPVLNVFGGRVVDGTRLTMTRRSGIVWYTTNGNDPRIPFSSAVSSEALRYADALSLRPPLRIRARTLDGTNWSALTSADFQAAAAPRPVVFSEIQYNPVGGDAYEFLELWNPGTTPVDLSGHQFSGITFRFPSQRAILAAGARFVLGNGTRPDLFRQRHPGTAVFGWYEGSLSNGGERLELRDAAGRLVAAAGYGDSPPWPRSADGGGSSLEFRDPSADPGDPTAWTAGAPGGTPGRPPQPASITPAVRIHEVHASGLPDWVELHNPGSTAVDVGGFSVTDNGEARRFVIPAGTRLGPGAFRVFSSAEGGVTAPDRLPFALDADGETLVLLDADGERVDGVRFGPQVPGFSMARDGSGTWVLAHPTPGAANQPLASRELSTALRLNEWQLSPPAGLPWIEVHNPDARPAAVSGWMLLASNTVFRLPGPAFVAPGGFLVLRLGPGSSPTRIDGDLPAGAGFLALQEPGGAEVERLSYAAPVRGTTLARIPDGSGAIQALASPGSPGLSNRVEVPGQTLRLSAFLARSGVDWVDVENFAGVPVSRAGLRLVIDPPDLPSRTVELDGPAPLAPGQRLRILGGAPAVPVADPLRLWSPLATLPDDGGEVRLEGDDGRVWDRVDYGPQVPGRPVWRNGPNWVLASGSDGPEPPFTPAAMSDGSGVRINEWLATGGRAMEFVELHNADPLPVDLSRWVLTDDPSIRGATNRTLPAPGFLAGKGFAPFRMDGSTAEVPGSRLDFRLNALGETLRLVAGHGGVVDSVDYTVQDEGVSEGFLPDGSTTRVRFPGRATPGRSNAQPEADSDGDGMPDDWETRNGLRPDAADGAGDPDGDGATNLREFLAGTDPRNPGSVFRLSVAREGRGWSLRFTAQADRSYRLEISDSVAGPWDRSQDIAAGTMAREVSLPLTWDAGQRFYRMVVVP